MFEEAEKHHIWCNFFHRPAKDCKFCEGLREEYPEEGTELEMMEKYFPDVVRRTVDRDEKA